MKASAHNYYVPYNDGTIFMNGITEATFWVSDEYASLFRQIIESPDQFNEYEPFINKLSSKGFIINEDTDEKELISQKYNSLRRSEEYRIMILPTYQCNLRCWYCVQEHQDLWMTDETFQKIKELIIRRIDNPEIKRLNVTWFGGEPLMVYNKVLEMTRFAQELSLKKGLQFFSSITTNGTLLTPKRIDELHAAGIRHYQITIDGEKDNHDSVKVLGSLSAFDTVLKNIAYLAKDTKCTLRFNYTKETLKPELIVQQIQDRIPHDVRHNVSLNLQPVWQTINKGEADFKDVVRMMELSEKMGVTPTLKPMGLCYVDFKHYDCVYPSGEIGKCENGITDMRHGLLKDNGEIDYSNAHTAHYLPTYECQDSECLKCKYLPFCWGPCSQKRFLLLQKGSKIGCLWENKDETLAEAIRNTYFTNKFLDRQE